MSEITPVAHIYTPFSSKFGIPRQSGLVGCVSEIVFTPQYRSPDAIRGIEGFSHLWLIWEFSENVGKSHSLTVRPPRLGGNKRMGVFATRSPFRPNCLGLSCVKIEKIDYECENAPVIYVSGADILNGTPVFDIKPYLPYTDSHPQARGGFAQEVFDDNLRVVFSDEALKHIRKDDLPILEELLKEDPRPHYQNDPDRVYAFEFSDYAVKFKVRENEVFVISISNF